MTLSSLGLAFSDVLVDAMVVARSRGKDQVGPLSSECGTCKIVNARFWPGIPGKSP